MTKQAKPFILFHNGGVGDFLMFIFLAQQLHASGVASHIALVVPRAGAFLQGLVAAYPYLSLREVSRRDPRAFIDLLSCALRPTGVLIYPTLGHIPMRLKLLAWIMTRAPGSTLAGFIDKGPLCRVLYSTAMPYDTSVNYSDLMRRTAVALGATADANPPHIVLPAVENLHGRYGLEGKQYVVFHPGAGMSTRRRSFADNDAVELSQALLGGYPELRIVLSAGPDERAWVAELAHKINSPHVQTVIAAPAAELGGLIAGAELYIGGDTGVTHLACFVGAKVLEVAHNGAPHWFCYYYPGAKVLYRLKDEQEVGSDKAYVMQKARGVIYPCTTVPAQAVLGEAKRILAASGMMGQH